MTAADVINALASKYRAPEYAFLTEVRNSLLQEGASTPEVATLLGNTATVVEKHYSAWVKSRQDALESLLRRMHGADPLAVAPSRKVVSIG